MHTSTNQRLLSITALAAKDLDVTSTGSICRIEYKEAVIVEVSKAEKLFILQCKRVEMQNWQDISKNEQNQ